MPFTNDDFFRIIGHISVFFATWDMFTTVLIVKLVEPHRPVLDLARMTLGQKLRFLEGLKHDEVIDTALLDRIHAALPAAYPISNERNRFIHDQWMFSPETIERGEIRLLSIQVATGEGGRGLTFPWRQYRIGDLHAFLGSVGQQQAIFASFAEQLPPLS